MTPTKQVESADRRALRAMTAAYLDGGLVRWEQKAAAAMDARAALTQPDPTAELVEALRRAHDLLQEEFAITTTPEGRKAMACMNHIRSALAKVTP